VLADATTVDLTVGGALYSLWPQDYQPHTDRPTRTGRHIVVSAARQVSWPDIAGWVTASLPLGMVALRLGSGWCSCPGHLCLGVRRSDEQGAASQTGVGLPVMLDGRSGRSVVKLRPADIQPSLAGHHLARRASSVPLMFSRDDATVPSCFAVVVRTLERASLDDSWNVVLTRAVLRSIVLSGLAS